MPDKDAKPSEAMNDEELRNTLAKMAGLKELPESVFIDSNDLIALINHREQALVQKVLGEVEAVIGEDDILTVQEADSKCEDIRVNTNASIKESRNGLRFKLRAALATIKERV